MFDYELELFDRLEVIRHVIDTHGEENFYLSFSGGKDSTVVHHLLDLALPHNRIPRVFCNTGIEFADIVRYVRELAKDDPRFQIITVGKPVLQTIEKVGYPFKSKEHSHYLSIYQNTHDPNSMTVAYYLKDGSFSCPKILRYQFTENFHLKVSDKCCMEFKKKPFATWQKQNGNAMAITGMRSSEGGHRKMLKGCVLTDKEGNIKKFHPLLKVDDEFENAFIADQNIKLCRLYYPPFEFKRTGCKGCPFSLDLQEQLTLMALYLPAERKQCEMIWRPVYEEYRRLNYRLNTSEQLKLF